MKTRGAAGPSTKARDKWLVSDELWEEIEPLLPRSKDQKHSRGGRPPVTDREAMDGIFFVLRTGNRERSILIRWEKDPDNYEALLHIAAGMLCLNRSNRKIRF